MKGLNIAFFGSSLVSAYWNGAATYYRGIVRALHERGNHVTFFEPDAYQRQQHRDMPDPEWAEVVVYSADGMSGVDGALDRARKADVIIKASGVGVFDDYLEKAVLEVKGSKSLAIFWDVDAPATLERLAQHPRDAFHKLIPQYDLILTYGGGNPVIDAYKSLNARQCVPIYNALDPTTHFPVKPEPQFEGDLGFLGNRLPDREARVEDFFLEAAKRCPNHKFLLGGSGWGDKAVPANVNYLGHVYTTQHNAFNCTPKAVLNVSRQSMAQYGFSPATRVFEAAGAAACMITDYWEGIEYFFEPDSEILVAHNGMEVGEHLKRLSVREARQIGQSAYNRVLAEHTYSHRIQQLEQTLGERVTSLPTPVKVDSTCAMAHKYKNESALRIVILGLSITSSWGNGHATTYRGIVRELSARGHDVLFLEHDKPWYSSNRDLPHPPFGRTELYNSVEDLKERFREQVAAADMVIVGSYVPEGVAVGEWVVEHARGITAFYDIDTPVTLSKLERGDSEYVSPALIRRYNLYLSFTGGPTLERLETQFGAATARPLYCSVDSSLYFPELIEKKWDLGYLGTYSLDRQPAIEQLMMEPARRAAQKSMVVAGPQYPADIIWPENVTRIEHLPPSEHRAFYNSQKLTLNVTRQDMIRAGYSPSVRLFEAAACAVPIVTDEWNGLADFFSAESEILIARTAEDVLRYLELSEKECQSIGRRAREKVLSAHTAAHRAEELESYAYEIINSARRGTVDRESRAAGS
jgi:spore maturation protein CgeB